MGDFRVSLAIILHFFVGCLLVSSTLANQELHWEMPREQVISILGEPESAVVGANRELLIYPNGIRIELLDGVVMGAKGVRLLTKPEDAIQFQQAKEKQSEPEPRRASSVEPSKPRPTPQTPVPEADDSAVEEYLATVSDYDPDLDFEEDEAIAAEDGVSWIVAFLLRLIIAAIALKIACEVTGTSVFLGGLSLIAVVDVLVRMGIGWILNVSGDWGMLFSMGYIDYAIPFLVMLGTVSKLTSARSFPSALRVAGATQMISVFAWLILINLALAMLH